MYKTEENATALKSIELPQYLASLGLKPQQIAGVIYGLFREVRQLGTLTPSSDNSVHLTKEKILKMAKDPTLETGLYNLFLKIQNSKDINVIFKKERKSANLTAPDLRHNSAGADVPLQIEENISEDVEILDFVKFLAACGIDPELVKSALKEKSLLEGENCEKLS